MSWVCQQPHSIRLFTKTWKCQKFLRVGSQNFFQKNKSVIGSNQQGIFDNVQGRQGGLDRIITGNEWFHYYEPESKSQSKQWKRRDEPVPIKVKAAPSAVKKMATVFWDREGILLIDWLPEINTIKSDYYTKELKELRKAIKRERRS